MLCPSDERAEQLVVHRDEECCLTSSSSVVPAVGSDAPFLRPSVAGSVAKAFAILDPSVPTAVSTGVALPRGVAHSPDDVARSPPVLA